LQILYEKVFIELIEYFSVLWLRFEHRYVLVVHSDLQDP